MIVIVGSGIAGLVTALALAPRPVTLITRAELGSGGSTVWAQGGIAAALGRGDDVARHLADTLAAGDGLCDPIAARAILSGAAEAVAFLERHGLRLDRDAGGDFVFGLEAAHSRRRILHVGGDGAGAAIAAALVTAVRRSPSITVLENTEVRRLLLRDGRTAGLLVARDGLCSALPARGVVLATGGLGGLYDATTNPPGNFGQGVMLAARAGAALADMEFVQFHPTALASPRHPRALISEAVRGEGAVLVNERGERFLARTPGAELASRDVVARAIHAQIARGGGVFLDARRIPVFASRFPVIDRLCREADIDPARHLIPVEPAAHYHMGGVQTDGRGRTTVPGLWAVGECAATGLHGANRLASNSLLEAAVMALRAAADIAGSDLPAPRDVSAQESIPPADPTLVRSIVSRYLGVQRDGPSLARAVSMLHPMAEGSGPAADPALVALTIAVAAHERRETRGAHSRVDHPERLPQSTRRTMDVSQVLLTARAIAPPRIARSA